MKSLSDEFGDLARELARRHRVPTELVIALLDLEGSIATETEPMSQLAAARHVEAVLLAHPFEDADFGKR